MKVIPISGIISNVQWEDESNVTPTTLRKSLSEANGEDILVTINTPGGYVYEGLEMFSQLKNYPGNVETRIISLAASMGSIIALAGNKKTAENTAMYMIHNVSGYSYGDHRSLRKDAADFEKLTDLLSGIIEQNTALTRKEARDYMDAETYFYGDDIKKLGFDIVDTEETLLVEDAIAMAKVKIKSVGSKMSNEEMYSDFKKAISNICAEDNTKKESNNFSYTGFAASNNINLISSSNTNGATKEEAMDLAELKTKYPEVYALAVEEGKKQGILSERDRVSAHLIRGQASGAIEMAINAIESGSEMTETIKAKYETFGKNKQDVQNRNDDDQDAGDAANGKDTGDHQENKTESEAEFIADQIEKKFSASK